MSRGPSGTSQGPVLGPYRRGKVHGYLWLEKITSLHRERSVGGPTWGLSSAIFGLGYNLECPDSQTVHLPLPTACCPIQRVTAYHYTLREAGGGQGGHLPMLGQPVVSPSPLHRHGKTLHVGCGGFPFPVPKRTASSFPMCGIGVYLFGMIHRTFKTLYTKTS